MSEAINQVITAILTGEVDDDFDRIAIALKERRKSLSAAKLLTFKRGDRVKVVPPISPKYMAGATGKVVKLGNSRIDIELDEQVGRYPSGVAIGFPPSTLELIEDQA